MRLVRYSLFAFLLALVPPTARADDATYLEALGRLPTEASLYGDLRYVDIVDFAALRAESGLPSALLLADVKSLPGEVADRLLAALHRLRGGPHFLNFLLYHPAGWTPWLGVDFLELEWFTQAGTPPNTLLLMGAEEIAPQEGLRDFGFAPQDHGGTTVWVKGEKDFALDIAGKEPGFPFWGELGANVRLFLYDGVLTGARGWPPLDLAIAVAGGEAESLADLPAYRLALAAAADPALSDGPVLRLFIGDEAFGKGVLRLEPAPDGLPPFALFALADRQDQTGQQAIVALTFEDAATAEEAASLLATRIADFPDDRGGTLAGRFPGLEVAPSVVTTADGAAAVVRLAIPPLPVLQDGKPADRSALFQYLHQRLMHADLGFLATKE